MLVIIVFVSLSFSPQVQSYVKLPLHQRIAVGDSLALNLNFPGKVLEKIKVRILSQNHVSTFSLDDGLTLPLASKPGRFSIQLSLFGVVPLKNVVVDVVPQQKVLPGGHSIGVVLQARGVMVVGFSGVASNKGGEQRYPAQEAGVQIGDIIAEVNGTPVTNDEDLAEMVDVAGQRGQQLKLIITRQGRKISFRIRPQFCRDTNRYRIGLLVRDTTAGVGTLTFYQKDTKRYAALGHLIADAQTEQHIQLGEGKIVQALVQGIEQGRRGQPGEKIGIFLEDGTLSGDIQKNTKVGIFGSLDRLPYNEYYQAPIPVAFANQVTEGPAEMLTVVSGDKVEKFNIRIEKVMPMQRASGKGLQIQITDPRLLDITGGIVQGMSGSPIIQGGKLVGAVTHVFVNDPKRGYGVLAEWMLLEMGLLETTMEKTG